MVRTAAEPLSECGREAAAFSLSWFYERAEADRDNS
jgi:hypothetical protein